MGRIDFCYETSFSLDDESQTRQWIKSACERHRFQAGDITYIFCDDNYLLNINKKYLKHDNFTDIITFDYSEDNLLSADIFISVERVEENARLFNNFFSEELNRVMAHGILHLMGYKDKKEKEVVEMRRKEEELMTLFHVEH